MLAVMLLCKISDLCRRDLARLHEEAESLDQNGRGPAMPTGDEITTQPTAAIKLDGLWCRLTAWARFKNLSESTRQWQASSLPPLLRKQHKEKCGALFGHPLLSLPATPDVRQALAKSLWFMNVFNTCDALRSWSSMRPASKAHEDT